MIYIGTSGFTYEHWYGRFYPEDLAQDERLRFYARRFNSVELNVTFYRMLNKKVFAKWDKETPKKFTFALKANRFITHIKRLKDCRAPIERFYESASPLKNKIKVVLWQLPPNLKPDLKVLKSFFRIISRRKYKNALEVRNNLWLDEKVIALLKKYNVALCFADWPGLNIENPKTADFNYVRRHGAQGLYYGWYSRERLEGMRQMIRGYMKRGQDAFVYFNNDADAAAAHNALELQWLLSQ